MTSGIAEMLQSFVEETVAKIVDNPDDVKIDVVVSTKAIMVQVEVTRPDRGKVIGKKGRTVDALKVIALAIKNTNFPDDSRRVAIEVLDDEAQSF